MTTATFDFKKAEKEFYPSKPNVTIVNIPEMTFIKMDGKGDPNGAEFQKAIEALYPVCYSIKMSKLGDYRIPNYFDFVVAPLEGLWWSEGAWSFEERDNWLWSLMIRQPEFVTSDVFNWAVQEAFRKKPEIDFSGLYIEKFTEGECVQSLHYGSYEYEMITVDRMKKLATEQGYFDTVGPEGGKHHEIYLSDTRKTEKSKLKTIIRHPIRNG